MRDPENRAAESVPFAANIFFIQIGKKSVISAWALTSTGRLSRATATQTTSALTPRVQFALTKSASATAPSVASKEASCGDYLSSRYSGIQTTRQAVRVTIVGALSPSSGNDRRQRGQRSYCSIRHPR